MTTTDEALETIRQAAEELDFVDLQKASRMIEKEQKRREKEARKQAQQEMKQVAQKYGLDLDEIVSGVSKGAGAKATKGNKVPPKFRHPEDPDRTWTGRGRKPKWVVHWEEELGRDIEELRIPDA
ncbi:H-NS family nucleoid-associated regulatory protein [Halorhodospira halophila]|uniref:Histone family protein nucleoid-structuring protein H-NS n=1 Tax=Halorhodospira halophila (strain DSM 244 / SL1) TaxID=349124 RepID=A1WU67_HALHL|nr:H-NS histone family protein [Halorhodospira halophila]ABM61229.1 histone family protein nucleoid-structuring protein H-NS [Halorhodospira halophila SL1]MBK1730039.1 trans-acting regulatory HvrA protein [Halorhodospira halophila]